MSNQPLLPISALLALPNTFMNKDEAIYYHKEVQALDAQLKFRRELDLGYAKLKQQKLIEEQNGLDFQMEFAEKRNDRLLNELQKDIFKNISTANITEQSKMKLEQFKEKYTEYLNYHRSHIQREFNYQILIKQNALIAKKAILENQVSQNERMLKTENEYCDKIHQTNVTLIEEIKRLQLQNARINEERQRKALDHQALENKLEEQSKLKEKEGDELSFGLKESSIIEDKKKNDNIQESIIQDSNLTKSQREKKTKVVVETKVTLNLNHKYGKLDQIRQSQLDESIRKEREMKNSQMSNSNIISNKSKSNVNSKINESVVVSPNKGKKESTFKQTKLPIYRNDKYMNEITPKTSTQINPLVRISNDLDNNSRGVTFGENTKGNESIDNIVISKPLQSSIASIESHNQLKDSKVASVNPLESIKLSQSIQVPQLPQNQNQSNINNNSNNNVDVKKSIKESIALSNKQIENSSLMQSKEEIVKQKEPQIGRNNSDEFEHNTNINNNKEEQKSNKPIRESQALNNKSELTESKLYGPELSSYEDIKQYKPKLNTKAVLPEYKLLVLKKLIQKIEKYSKTQKAGKQIYLIKHTNTKGIEDQLKDKFYDLLANIKEDPSNEEAFTFLEINTALQLVFQILSSNPNANLKESNLGNNKKVYDEEIFLNDIDEQFKDVIKAVLDHMRTMISNKKISLQLACTFMAKGLLNFNHNNTMESKLLLVLEKQLTQKNTAASTMLFANTFSSGFNTTPMAFHQSNTKLPSQLNPLSNSSNLKKAKNTEDIFDQYE